MQAPQLDSMVGRYVGRYRVTRKIGMGQLGGVYEVVQQSIGHRAAMKVLRPELAGDPQNKKYLDRFVDEARAVNLINHPGVVKVFDLSETDDKSVYILMEYLDGIELSSYQRKVREGAEPPFLVPQLLGIVKQLASVLAVAHEKGILHRDIKPQDVFLITDANYASGYRVKLLDFGVALFLDTPERRTTAGIALGTPLYMSPEQCLGADDIDGKSDVYSLGAILYEALAGTPPFVGDMSDVMRSHVREVPPPLAQRTQGIAPPVLALVDQLLAKRKEDRPTMHELEQRIVELEKSGVLTTVSAPPAAKAPAAASPSVAPGPRRPPAPLWMVGLLGAGLLVGGLAATLARRTPTPPACPQVICPVVAAPAPPKPAVAPPEAEVSDEKSAEPTAKERAAGKNPGGKATDKAKSHPRHPK